MSRLGAVLLVLALVAGCGGEGTEEAATQTVTKTVTATPSAEEMPHEPEVTGGTAVSPEDPESLHGPPPGEMLTYQQVVDAACGKRKVEREESPEMFTSASANCGHAAVAMFSGPSGIENWLGFFEGKPVLLGTNWAVWIDSFDPMPAYEKVQTQIGGDIVKGGPSD